MQLPHRSVFPTPRRAAVRTGLLALALASACASGPPEALRVPSNVASERDHLPFLYEQVEQLDGPPEWAHRYDDEGRFLYGLGVLPRDAVRGDPVHAVRREAAGAVIAALERSMAVSSSIQLTRAELRLARETIELERLGIDERSGSWYALGRLDLPRAVARVGDAVAVLDAELASDAAALDAAPARKELGVGQALAILVGLDRRSQLRDLAVLLGGPAASTDARLDEAALESRAREVLRSNAVRVRVDGPDAVAIADTIRAELGTVYLAPAEDDGASGWSWEVERVEGPLISVRLREAGEWSPRDPYRIVEGELELSLEGPEGRTHVVPLRAVGRGKSYEEATERAVRTARVEVRDLLRVALHPGKRID